jgi:hypothetical protein
MSSFQSRKTIPDTWAQIGACPICDERTLSVLHIAGRPDQMTCGSCHVAFELEADGPNIRLQTLPPKYAAYIQPAWQSWVTPHEIRRQLKVVEVAVETEPKTTPMPTDAAVRRLNQVISTPTPVSQDPSFFADELPLEPLSQEEVTKRAAGLAALGNTSAEVRTALQRFNASEEQIAHAMAYVYAQKKSKKSRTPRAIIVVLLILIVCLGAAAFLLPLLNIPKYIDIIAPIWNTLQSSFTNNSIYGGVEGNPNTTPDHPNGSLSAGDQNYFNTLWNLGSKNSWIEKYVALQNVRVPAGLTEFHASVMQEYWGVAVLEAEYNKDMAVYNSLCVTDDQIKNTICNRVNLDQADLLRYLQAAEDSLDKWWLNTACDKYHKYYNAQGAAFPFADGNCSKP